MLVKQLGKFKVIKDGTTFYRVLDGRKRIGSFLFLSEAINYMVERYELQKSKGE